ncbi:GNAT family N-acetyltransferase [Rossellomorea aquimaris]|uniref:GNAT family N-acetyltransferase n=1 Tax=Rossellomorea aquimaris TaxID=189382 RepID=UPI001CFDE233|nr:GNAT family N-acetyltransferase [Rossellomorea aquimaris]
MEVRLAESKDIEQLIKMRWDNTIEFDENKKDESYDEFAEECRRFLEDAIRNNQWFIWVADDQGTLASHIYIELVHKVPRPGRITRPFAYMTNVYTIPEYRNAGVGSRVLKNVNTWVKDKKYEFIIVWPSDEAVNYYKKNDYVHCTEPLEYFPS